MEKQLSDELGFYYVIMQRSLHGQYINCWIDGSDYPEYYTYEELVELARKSSNSNRVLAELRKVINETSMFIWDVDNETISYDFAGTDTPNLSQDLQNSFNREMKNKQYSKSSAFTNVTFQNNQITLKI